MKPDAGLIVAVQRNQTGADTHKLNNLLHLYMNACYLTNHALADSAKQKLMAVLIEKEWEACNFPLLTNPNCEDELYARQVLRQEAGVSASSSLEERRN